MSINNIKPAARVTDLTECPTPGHGANPVVTGSPNIFIEGLPAVRQGDKTACGSEVITGVSSTVFFNGLPAAVTGSLCSHGNIIVGGSGTVLIGDIVPVPAVHAPYKARVRVYDPETGEPVVGEAVHVTSTGGHDATEITDAQGLTGWVHHELSETLAVKLPGGQDDEQ